MTGVAVVAVTGALPLAVAVAFLLARGRFPGRAFVDSLVHLPLVLPPVVMGYLLLITFGTRAPLGAWLLDTFGFRFAFSWTGAARPSASRRPTVVSASRACEPPSASTAATVPSA